MESQILIRRITSAILAVLIVFALPLSAAAADGYDILFSLTTDSTSGWTSSGSTTVSDNMIKHDDRPAVSFSSELDSVSGQYAFTAKWEELGANVNSVVLNLNFFVSDVSVMTGSNGKLLPGHISFMSDEGYGFRWDISDFPLKTGWNSVTLNFRTAEAVVPEKPDAEEDAAENAEEQTEEQAETAEQTEVTVLTQEEYLPLINIFGFKFEKTTAKSLTVAFSEVSVSVRSKGEEAEPPEPMTDEINNGLLIAALIISVLIIAAVLVFSARYAKKEIKRKKREAKLKRQKNNQEQ